MQARESEARLTRHSEATSIAAVASAPPRTACDAPGQPPRTMSSLDNGLPRFDRLDLSPTKWEPDAAVARQPTPTKPVISKPSRKIPLRVPSKNVRDVDLDGIIAPHNVGEAPTPRYH